MRINKYHLDIKLSILLGFLLLAVGMLGNAPTAQAGASPFYLGDELNSRMSWHSRDLPTRKQFPGAIDDKCYATLSTLSTVPESLAIPKPVANQLTQGNKFGMVNAIVRIPVYDWDVSDAAIQNNRPTITDKQPGPRPIGYAQSFRFRVTPVPGKNWLVDYFRNPGIREDPYLRSKYAIANPFVYQQFGITNPDGLPIPLILRDKRGDAMTAAEQALAAQYGKSDNLSVGVTSTSNPGAAQGAFDGLMGADTSAKIEPITVVSPANPQDLSEKYTGVITGSVNKTSTDPRDPGPMQDVLANPSKYEIRSTFGAKEQRFYGFILGNWKDTGNSTLFDLGASNINNDGRFEVRISQAQADALKRWYPYGGGIFSDVRTEFTGWKFAVYVKGTNTQVGPAWNAVEQQKKLGEALTKVGTIDGLANNLESTIAATNQTNINALKSSRDFSEGNVVTKMASSPIYRVNGAEPRDKCYEDIRNNNPQMTPAYAFSVTSATLPLPIPGLLFSIPTLIFKGHPSFSGPTLYGSSLNGKDMIDCFGRGLVTTLYPGPEKMNQDPITGGLSALFGNERGFWSTIAWGILAATNGTIDIRNFPVPYTGWEDYYSGLNFKFDVDPYTIALPPELKNRVIAVEKGKYSDFDVMKWLGGKSGLQSAKNRSDPSAHDVSENGNTTYPHLYVKLKKPYELQPDFEISDPRPGATPDPNSPYQDGLTFNVKTVIDHDGFNEIGKYNKRSGGGGQTFFGTETFSHLTTVVMKFKPGVQPNAINTAKRNAGVSPWYLGEKLQADGLPLGANANQVCGYLKGRLQAGDPDAAKIENRGDNSNNLNPAQIANGVSCEKFQHENYDVRLAENSGGLKIDGTYTIPAEEEPGTKVCFAAYLDSYGNDMKYKDSRQYHNASKNNIGINQNQYWPNIPNYNNNYSAERAKQRLTRVKCITTGYRPSFQVRGGDMFTKGNIYTDVNTKKYLAGAGNRTYGSWAEYGLIASGVINQKMASGGLMRTGYETTVDDKGYLTFANHKTPPKYGNFTDGSTNNLSDGVAKVVGYFSNYSAGSSKIEDATKTPPGCYTAGDKKIHVDKCGKGVYRLESGEYNVTVDAGTSEINADQSLIFLVNDNVKIFMEKNVRIPQHYNSANEMSQVLFVPNSGRDGKFNIYIKPEVTALDAWLINPKGGINTCYTGGGMDVPRTRLYPADESTPTAHPCYGDGKDKQLIVNGPVATDTLLLRRSGGKDQSGSAGSVPTEVHQSISGEIFNLRPDAYIWALNQVNAAGKKYTTSQVKDLPPRY